MEMKKSRQRKASLAGSIIASICIIVYLVALVSAAIRIYLSIDQHRADAEREFIGIADLASSAGVLGFMDDPFIETVNDALVSSRTLEALIISGPDGEYAFERQKDRAINWVNNSPRFKNRFDLSSQSLYTPLRIQGLRNVNIQAVAVAADFSLLGGILKETLLVVLAGFLLAFFTLLVESLLGKSGGKQMGQYRPAAGPAFTETPLKPLVVDEDLPKEEENAAPKGLYSPRSNIGWEEYITERLESELHRCASSEQDLAMVVMELWDTYDDSLFRAVSREAVDFFGSKDLLFERGERGISVICPGIDIWTGLGKAEDFHTRIMGSYSDALVVNTNFCIGLTSRSGRLVNAERILFEANEALNRAKADPVSPILAFKSDPDKYRKFIAAQNQQQI